MRRLRTYLGQRDRSEIVILAGLLLVLLAVLGFLELAEAVREGATQRFDERLLAALRRPGDASVPTGPRWLHGAALDITALGGAAVLGLAVAAIAGFLVLQGMPRMALFVVAASAGGWLLNHVLKEVFQRARPDVVPHLREVLTLSFPSGHAMTSAAVYLTLGAMLMRVAHRPVTKVYCIAVAVVATVLVGSSRVYLGVHYPTDVLAGWMIGLSWAILCLAVERTIERRTGLRRERVEQDSL